MQDLDNFSVVYYEGKPYLMRRKGGKDGKIWNEWGARQDVFACAMDNGSVEKANIVTLPDKIGCGPGMWKSKPWGGTDEDAICCPMNSRNSDGICCESGTTNSNGICCPDGSYNNEGVGKCCPRGERGVLRGGRIPICCPKDRVTADGKECCYNERRAMLKRDLQLYPVGNDCCLPPNIMTDEEGNQTCCTGGFYEKDGEEVCCHGRISTRNGKKQCCTPISKGSATLRCTTIE